MWVGNGLHQWLICESSNSVIREVYGKLSNSGALIRLSGPSAARDASNEASGTRAFLNAGGIWGATSSSRVAQENHNTPVLIAITRIAVSIAP